MGTQVDLGVSRSRFFRYRQSGFTLVELLVVIGIIALLISILLPSLAAAREQSKITVCSSNLRQAAAAFNMYAAENKGKLPQHTGNSNWLFDIPLRSRDELVAKGTVRTVFYCPANFESQDVENLWNFPNPTSPVHAATGYQWLFRRIPPNGMPALNFNRQYLRAMHEKQGIDVNGVRLPHSPSDLELGTDMVNSRGAPGTAAENFRGALGGHPTSHHTAHMKKEKPRGGNILFLDGHVYFRDFGEMRIQTQHSGNNYYF